MEQGITHLRCAAFGLLLVAGAACAQSAAPAPARTDKASLSYAIGYQIGSQFADGDPAVDLATLERAIQDAAAKRQPSVPMQDMRAQLRALDDQMHARAVNEFRRVAAANARM